MLTRRRFIQGMLAGAAVGAVGAAGGSIQPHHPAVKAITIGLARLPEQFHGYRSAQLSDIHFGPYIGRSDVERALALIEPFRPDRMVFTGVFVSHRLCKT